MEKLRELLIERNYRPGLVDSAISRARAIPREVALRPKANNQPTRRPVHTVTYDPRLPQIQAIHQKHWRSMKVQDPRLAEVFPNPPLVAFKRQKNIKDYLIRSKVPSKQSTQPKRNKSGMKKCGKSCPSCPYIKEGKSIQNKNTNWKINGQLNCKSSNIIYLIECKKETCKIRYIGETERTLHERLSDHRGYVKRLIPTQTTGEHFNSPGHSLSDLTITIIEQVKKGGELYRKEREKFHIKKFNTYNK